MISSNNLFIVNNCLSVSSFMVPGNICMDTECVSVDRMPSFSLAPFKKLRTLLK